MDTNALANAANSYWNNLQGQSLLFPPNSEDYRGQCVQPVEFYMRDYLHLPVLHYSDAYKYIAGGAGYTVVPNDPSDLSQIPTRGAIIVWNASLPGSLNSGHIAVYWQTNAAGSHTFISLDSNWGGKTLHMVTHNWSNVAGWLVPNAAPTVVTASATVAAPAAPQTTQSGGDEMITTDDATVKIYKMLRPNSTPDAGEIAQTTNKRTYVQFVNDAQNEVAQRDANLASQSSQLQTMENTINQLNATVTTLQASQTTSKADYDKALGEVSDLTAQLSTARDTISDLQGELVNQHLPAATTDGATETADTTPADPKAALMTRLIAWLIRKR